MTIKTNGCENRILVTVTGLDLATEYIVNSCTKSADIMYACMLLVDIESQLPE